MKVSLDIMDQAARNVSTILRHVPFAFRKHLHCRQGLDVSCRRRAHRCGRVQTLPNAGTGMSNVGIIDPEPVWGVCLCGVGLIQASRGKIGS